MFVDVLFENNPLFIVDIGANSGIDSRWSDFTKHYKSVLFESDKKEYQSIKPNTRDNSIVLQTTLLDMKKQLDFYVSLYVSITYSDFIFPCKTDLDLFIKNLND